ncbi:SIS domain-containing protein [Spirillospora sp. CA-255316]
MAEEIAEQPQVVADTLEALRPLAPQVRRVAGGRRHVLLVARGSSDNAAVYGRYLVETMTGRHAALAAPSVAVHYKAGIDLGDTLTISLSQSGRTEEIVETQQWARAHGSRTIAVTNSPDSPLAHGADLALVTRAGAERAVPATKTYTAQLAAMAVIADALAPEDEGFTTELASVPDRLRLLLTRQDERHDQAAATLAEMVGRTVVVSRGIAQTTALEVALKLEETCLHPVRGLSYSDLRHGPLAVLDEQVATVLIAPGDGPVLYGLLRQARDIRATGSTVIGIGGDAAFAAECDIALPGPALTERLAPIGLIVPGQLVIEAAALRLGLNPDRPRGLAKVTQTDPQKG